MPWLGIGVILGWAWENHGSLSVWDRASRHWFLEVVIAARRPRGKFGQQVNAEGCSRPRQAMPRPRPPEGCRYQAGGLTQSSKTAAVGNILFCSHEHLFCPMVVRASPSWHFCDDALQV